MRFLLLLLLSAATLFSQEKTIPELKLTNGKIFYEVVVLRYDHDKVMLRSKTGIGPISYQMISEPARSEFIAARDLAISTKKKKEDAAQKAIADKEAADRGKIQNAKTHAESVEAAIAQRKIIVGMTRSEAERAWGEPTRKNTSRGSRGSREQWVYVRSKTVSQYVYFEDGLLTSWQSSEH